MRAAGAAAAPCLPVVDSGGFKKAPKKKAGGQAGFEF
jgi:hypothetical protein